ncbi:MAG: hypothetical protein GJ679_05880 [Rhodobacteraceae bacterium]|uniref:hypothetical protein n=1 Tax=Roseovarius sp. 10 TaxID=3080563 RepID=UPI0019358356|nr:hypothetical protein [Roseovarius sp. 10]MBE1289519.1 hypothetical protein [Paracoccaceae bacterium]MDV7200670.1 hypothetical protein [Roseovarius sp. 10]QPI85420.1 hypothetical protein I3V23_12920 [Rhodobacterales bacterium HKCCA1288]
MRAITRWRGAVMAWLCLLATGGMMAPGHAAGRLLIQNDGGGPLGDYILHTRLAGLTHDEVQITGWCASACTLYLSLPQTCVSRDAQFGFHAPSGGTAAQNRDALRLFAEYLPANLQGWYLREAAHLTGREYRALSGADLVAMGAARPCRAS